MNNKVFTPGPPPRLYHLDHVRSKHGTEGHLGMFQALWALWKSASQVVQLELCGADPFSTTLGQG